MDPSSNPSERFLARALRRRSSRSELHRERLLHWLVILVRIAVVLAILAALGTYLYFCLTVHCDKADCPAKTAETSDEVARNAAKPPEPGARKILYSWVQLMPDQDDTNTPGGRLVRTIGPKGGTCPTITQGTRIIPMRERAPSAQAAFPVLLCERVLIDNSEARVGTIALPARPEQPNDIVVLGDTGCRMTNFKVQPCRVPDGWPFAQVAENAAGQIVRGKSFVLHLGDFHYREHPCIDSSTDCGTSPFGDNWDTWNAEFFEPAKKLLETAPWVIMRGNHEDCERAGAGWIFLFGLPGQYDSQKACDSEAQMYRLTIGTTEETPPRPRILAVLDTSEEKNKYRIEVNCTQYEELWKQIETLKPEGDKREVWLALHQPLWGRLMKPTQRDLDKQGKNPCEALARAKGKQGGANATPQGADARSGAANETEPDAKNNADAAANTRDAAADTKDKKARKDEKEGSPLAVFRGKFAAAKDKRLARLVLGGDTHAFQFFWPKAGSTPIQIIAGNSGTDLDKLFKPKPENNDAGNGQNSNNNDKNDSNAGEANPDKEVEPDRDSPKVTDVTSLGIPGSNLTLVQHGFTVMHRVGTTWSATQLDRDGKTLAVCQFSEALSPSGAPNCNDILTRAPPSN